MEIITTMITPYKSNGDIDYATAEKYVDWYYKSGINGIFAVCQSSEIFHLTLEERVRLNKTVYECAKRIDKNFLVVSSGHISDSIKEQAKELNAIYESGTDALILITNRLDINNEGDDVFIKNATELFDNLPKEAKLGLYECPYPYKRLVTPKILDWCLSTGRFYYLKDTCCDLTLIKQRASQLKGTSFKLLNANCQTLLESMRSGAGGYCGVMCNYHPKLYAWLGKNYLSQKADFIQSVIGTFGFTESGLPYPLTAKYHMTLSGITTENLARNRNSDALTEYAKECTRQMKHATDQLEKYLENEL